MKMLGRNRRKNNVEGNGPDIERSQPEAPRERPKRGYNHNGHKISRGIEGEGESGRKGIHPWHFIRIGFKSTSKVSMLVNILWPFVPAAIAIHFARPALHEWIFALNYVAMVPTANLLGFAGQELGRKVPNVLGVALELFLAGIVEIVLFMVLLTKNNSATDHLIHVIQAAILGSILANLLLCLGFCFFVGGINKEEQDFDEPISEVGSGLILVAGFGLLIPSAFYTSLKNTGKVNPALLDEKVLKISQVTAIILLVAFLIYVWFQMHTHHSIYEEVLEKDNQRDHDRHNQLKKAKLTMTECIVALTIALTCVSFHAVFLVQEIEHVADKGVSDAFMGLILVPFVEKLAKHLTAVAEALDNRMNFALAHVLGATLQTALFNAPLVVIVGWGLGKKMDLNFQIFDVVLLILSIIVVGNFLRDGKSNYLEGALCILVYFIIAVSAFYFPNLH